MSYLERKILPEVIHEVAVKEGYFVDLEVTGLDPGFRVVSWRQIGNEVYPHAIYKLNIQIEVGHRQVEATADLNQFVLVELIRRSLQCQNFVSGAAVVDVLVLLFEAGPYADPQAFEWNSVFLGSFKHLHAALVVGAEVLNGGHLRWGKSRYEQDQHRAEACPSDCLGFHGKKELSFYSVGSGPLWPGEYDIELY